jgi:hypothetical protein
VVEIELAKKATKNTVKKRAVKKSPKIYTNKRKQETKKPLVLEENTAISDVDDSQYEQAMPEEYDNNEIDDVENEYDSTVKSPESDVVASYICYHCDLVFATFSLFCQHRDQHNTSKTFVAIKRVCNLCFEPTEAYIQHLFEIHPSYKPNKCLQCDATFLHQYDLRSHLVKHLKTRIYECRACLHRFSEYK